MVVEGDEQFLHGGNVNSVVKVGATARRQQRHNSKTIHRFLRHLSRYHLPTPEFIGIDEKGREILSFVVGDTDFPPDLWTNDIYLKNMGKLLRKLHEASIDFEMNQDVHWAYSYPDRDRHEVINHNDFAPYNMVFGQDGSVAIIDFDLIGPGPRSRDLAYLAYWIAPLSLGPNALFEDPSSDIKVKCDRVRLLCSLYGFDQPVALVPMVHEVLVHMSDDNAAVSMIGTEAARSLKTGGHFDHWATEATAFERNMNDLIDLLSAK